MSRRMISLPVCRWRAQVAADQILCTSSKFLHAPNLVPAKLCLDCEVRDHEPSPLLPRALPCVHLGEATGKSVATRRGVSRELFTCVLHGRCAADGTEDNLPGKVRACSRCDDYLSRDPFGPNSAEMSQRAEAFLAKIPDYPVCRHEGRGIVIAGGGEKYFASLYVTIRALRHVGCELPIQVWYLGRNKEMPPDKRALLAPWKVECVDADKVRRRYPACRLDGWELKVFAVLHCSFEEVLFLDADCYPCRNPEFLFELEDYRTLGAIFWPDVMTVDTRLKWSAFGLANPGQPGSIESGQFVLNKRRVWEPLNLAWHYNNHSDYYYRYGFGDKHTFEVAWRRCEQPFVLWEPRARWVHVAYLHTGPEGDALFVHRCADKFRLDAQDYSTDQRTKLPRFFAELPLEVECWQWLMEVARAVGAPLPSPDGAVLKSVRIAARRITVGTLFTPQIASYGEASAQVLRSYAAHHGYRTVIETDVIDRQRPPHWSKIRLIERTFAKHPTCEWFFWIDADALIMRTDVPLSTLLDDEADFIVGDDPYEPLNTGVFLIRNCRAAKALLRRAYAKTQYLGHHPFEQAAITEVLRERVPGLRVKVVPGRLFNSFAEQYQPGDFVMHFAGRGHAERVREIPARAATVLHPPPVHFRPGNGDRTIFDSIHIANEYRLPNDMVGANVLDIGGHIGSFVYACAARGSNEIWSVEAKLENFQLLNHHIAEMPFPTKCIGLFGAAWRSDRRPRPLRLEPGDGANLAAFRITSGLGENTTVHRFDDIVRQMTNDGERRIHLLKLDCEGSEFPILFTSRTLAWIDAICAEVHPYAAGLPQFHVEGRQNTYDGLRAFLETHGFIVTRDAAPSSTCNYHLWAQRTMPTA